MPFRRAPAPRLLPVSPWLASKPLFSSLRNLRHVSSDDEAAADRACRLRVGAAFEAGLLAADRDEELARLDHAAATVVNQTQLPRLKREGDASPLAWLKRDAAQPLQRPDRHRHARRNVRHVQLDDLFALAPALTLAALSFRLPYSNLV